MFNNSPNSFLFDFVRKKPKYITIASVLSLSGTLLSVLSIILLVPLLFIILNGDIANIPSNFSGLSRFYLKVINIFDQDYYLPGLISIIFLNSLISILLAHFSSIFSIKSNKHLIFEIKKNSFDSLAKVDLDYYFRQRISDILFKINREVDRVALTIKNSHQIFINLIKILFLLIILLIISWHLSLIATVILIFSLAVNKYVSSCIKNQESKILQQSQIYNHKTIDFLTGIEHIKYAVNEKQEIKEILKIIKRKQQAELIIQSTSHLIKSINKLFNPIVILIIGMSSYYLHDHKIEVFIPVALVYLLIFFKLLSLINQLNNARYQLIKNRSSIKIINSFFKELSIPNIQTGKINFPGLKNKIQFHNVTFAYPHHANLILDKINLSFLQGKTIALVGSAGAGKSTLVNLLARLYEPIEGRITIDQQNIADYTLDSLRRSIAIIKQDPFLFNESIFYNLTYGLNNISQTDVITAAKKTQAYNFISRQSNGFNTQVSNQEVIISELEKQLIIITRALLSNPSLVILDEPMKNIHKSHRHLLQNALNELCRDRTTILITNRLAAIKKADQIVILNKGKVIESGTHQELLKNSNLYKQMCSAQFKTSQQSHQQLLAKKISKKLSYQSQNNLSYEIRNNLNSLLNYLQIINEGLAEDDLEQERILDESYQSAKNMLASLREYERKISQGFKEKN